MFFEGLYHRVVLLSAVSRSRASGFWGAAGLKALNLRLQGCRVWGLGF